MIVGMVQAFMIGMAIVVGMICAPFALIAMAILLLVILVGLAAMFELVRSAVACAFRYAQKAFKYQERRLKF